MLYSMPWLSTMVVKFYKGFHRQLVAFGLLTVVLFSPINQFQVPFLLQLTKNRTIFPKTKPFKYWHWLHFISRLWYEWPKTKFPVIKIGFDCNSQKYWINLFKQTMWLVFCYIISTKVIAQSAKNGARNFIDFQKERLWESYFGLAVNIDRSTRIYWESGVIQNTDPWRSNHAS